jgi:hypothetical protein
MAQEHAVLPEQCNADRALWEHVTKADVDKMSAHDLSLRAVEMWNCAAYAPAPPWNKPEERSCLEVAQLYELKNQTAL